MSTKTITKKTVAQDEPTTATPAKKTFTKKGVTKTTDTKGKAKSDPEPKMEIKTEIKTKTTDTVPITETEEIAIGIEGGASQAKDAENTTSNDPVDFVAMLDRHHDFLKEMMKENRTMKKEMVRLQKRDDLLAKKLEKRKKSDNTPRKPPQAISFDQSAEEHVSQTLADFIRSISGYEEYDGINRQDCVKIINLYIKEHELGTKGGFKLDETLSKLFPNLDAQTEKDEVIKRTEIMGAMNQHFPPPKNAKKNDTTTTTTE